MTVIKKIAIISLTTTFLLSAVGMEARNKKKEKKYVKKEVVLEPEVPVVQEPKPVAITNAPKQLYGEWDIETLRKKPLITSQRAYLYLDFNLHRVYGNTGGTCFNCEFKQHGNNISFTEAITPIENKQTNNERDIFKALKDVQQFSVTVQYGVETLTLANGKGQPLMTLRRQSLDFLNGPWLVKELDGQIVIDKNARLVVDAPMLTLHGNTGCNIINGAIHIDTDKDLAISFEDIHSSGNICDNIAVETALLIALEQAESAKRINDNEMALLDRKGKIVVVLSRLNMRKL